MIFADKLIALRKTRNMSQEELARQIGVTRQSVSKWESMQSMPDLEKVLRLSRFFDVSTDYLLKEELEEGLRDPRREYYGRRKMSRQVADEFIKTNKKAALRAALGTVFCFMGPALYTVIAELPLFSGSIGDGIGSSLVLIMAAIGVGLYVFAYERYQSFKWVRKEIFDREYGLGVVIENTKNKTKKYLAVINVLGWALIFLSPVPFTVIESFTKKYNIYEAVGSSLVVVLSGIGFAMIIYSFISLSGYDMLMQTGRYSAAKKLIRPKLFPVKLAYVAFSLRILIFMKIKLFGSFDMMQYIMIAIILSVALYPATISVSEHFVKKKNNAG